MLDMVTLKIADLDQFRTIQNLTQSTKTLHLSYDRSYSVTYLLICDIRPLSGYDYDDPTLT
jgi:hypothetical protein